MKFPNNEYYDGEFQLNKRNGYGRYVYQDHSEYFGQWKDDLRNGKGKIKNNDNNGNWFQAQFEADVVKGEVKGDVDGFRVVAEVDKGKLNGPIKMISNDTEIQTSYRDGKKEGRLLMNKLNGKG